MARAQRIPIAGGEAGIAADERGRRELVRRGVALGGAAVAASAIPLLLRVRRALAANEAVADKEILAQAVELEQVAVFAYETAVASGLLDRRLARAAERFRDHERQHADALIAALRELGGTPPPKPDGLQDVNKVLNGLGAVRSQRELVSFAIELEAMTLAAYHDAQRNLNDAKLLQLFATIMAAEGQQLVVLRQAVGRDPVPRALETGAQR